MKGVWKAHGTTFQSSMCWYARMLRKSDMWRLLKRNHNLLRQCFYFLFSFFFLVSLNDTFLQVIPTFLYRKSRLDVTCLVFYIEGFKRPSFRRRFSDHLQTQIPSTDLLGRPITMQNTMVRRANAWKNQLESLPKHLEIV